MGIEETGKDTANKDDRTNSIDIYDVEGCSSQSIGLARPQWKGKKKSGRTGI